MPTTKTSIYLVLALFCFGPMLCNAVTAQTKTESRPNIVMIMADDLGYECIGANGGTSYNTPHLDELAETGIRFEHCYAQPICTPSRVKLMTGIYNVRNYENFGHLATNQTTFANVLRESGYRTCIVGKWQLGTDPQLPKHFGFDEHCLWHFLRRVERYPNPGLDINGKQVNFTNGEYGPDVVNDFACDFIERNSESPFLLYYPMILTHCPFCPTPESADWDPTNRGSATYKGDPKYFGDMVAYMDKMIGKLVTKLEGLGIRENTLVMFVGDNGTDTPIVSLMDGRKVIGSKGQTIDAGTRVPFIANWRSTIPPGQVSKDLVTFTDFFQTMCAVADLPSPPLAKRDGQSFLPQLKGETGTPRLWIYCFYARNGGLTGKEFVRNQRYKLYRTGEFFDVAKDDREQTPLSLESLSKNQQEAYAQLVIALGQFQNARPAAVAEVGEAIKRRNRKRQAAAEPSNSR